MNYKERKELVKSYIGKTISIKIDRPIGYVHRKESYSLTYPINYGFIPGVLGGDGEELDAYVLGVDAPVAEFTGTVIGIIHRDNDVEDKLVMAPEGVLYNQAEIAQAVRFQEQYYTTRVEALYEKSCGAVIYRISEGEIELLVLLQSKSRTWSFPKGRMEYGETELETAQREVFEESGLRLPFVSGFRKEIYYRTEKAAKKLVVLFIAQADMPPVIDRREITEYRWLSVSETKKVMHSEFADLINEAAEFIKRA